MEVSQYKYIYKQTRIISLNVCQEQMSRLYKKDILMVKLLKLHVSNHCHGLFRKMYSVDISISLCKHLFIIHLIYLKAVRHTISCGTVIYRVNN